MGQDFVIHSESNIVDCVPGASLTKGDYDLAVGAFLALLRGSQKQGVKRVIFTSTLPVFLKRDATFEIHESTLPDPEACMNASDKAKLRAELAGRSFLQSIVGEKKVELVTMNPGHLVGPGVEGSSFSSGGIVGSILSKEMSALPAVQLPLVDVRDCAKAHVEALECPKAAGERITLVARPVWCTEVAQIMSSNLGKKANVTQSEVPHWMVRLGSWLSSDVNSLRQYWKRELTISNTKSVELLGLKYTSAEDTIIETANASGF